MTNLNYIETLHAARLEGARLMQVAIRDTFDGVDLATMAVWKIREAVMLVKPEEIVRP